MKHPHLHTLQKPFMVLPLLQRRKKDEKNI